MNHVELFHLLFRWLHVLSAVMWIGQIWSLVVVLRLTPDERVDTAASRMLLRAHQWLRSSAGLTWLTGIPLLIIVYYAGGALTTPNQSLWLAIGIGVGTILVGWIAYDLLWRFLRDSPTTAMFVSLGLLSILGLWLGRVMTGRAMFIHMGAMLGTIMSNNVEQRIWPVERLRLTPGLAAPAADRIHMAAQRLRHNAALAVAVVLFMVSNHFPLVYGHTRSWLIPPVLVGLIWLTCRMVSFRTPSRAPQPV